MLSRGVITEINGCISTGKEANVYHATAKDGSDRAVKVNMVITLNIWAQLFKANEIVS